MRPPRFVWVQRSSLGSICPSVHGRRSQRSICRFVAHHTQILDPEVQELVDRLERARDGNVVLELNRDRLTGQSLEEREDELKKGEVESRCQA